jgi:hypothetical protein
MSKRLFIAMVAACVLLTSCGAGHRSKRDDPGPAFVATSADSGTEFRERLLRVPAPTTDARGNPAFVVLMDMRVEEGVVTVAAFPNGSSAYAADTWNDVALNSGLPVTIGIAREIVQRATYTHLRGFERDCDGAPPAMDMARVIAVAADEVHCLPPIPINSIRINVDPREFDYYTELWSVYALLKAEPSI